ncbi:MAG TPA: 4-hydroxy-tetrahydrodipicolinate reductase [Rhodanobacteraceae bacterium]|nr:4-hydroxy-tetrahydrodipicolinate reductase [Rhodanobacteraceae bacterium]
MDHTIDIAVNGAGGRMGKAVLRASADRRDVRIVAALVRPESGLAGQTPPIPNGIAPDLRYTTALDASTQPAVLIDFSGAGGFDAALALACQRGMAFVCGSTGLSASQQAALDETAQIIPLLWSANFSLGMAALTRAVRDVAQRLAGWDCEIVEAHHRQKQDAPSGTALALGRAVADARGQAFDDVAQFTHAGVSGTRAAGAVGFAVVRGGDIAGEHAVMFIGTGERIELCHRASDRGIFARGAMAAAAWIAGRAPRRYALDEVQADATT